MTEPSGPLARDRSQQAKIVATLGPASNSEEAIAGLVRAGADVFRLNFSHGTREEQVETYRRVRSVGRDLGAPVAVLADVQGPKIRTGALAGGTPVELQPGGCFTITSRPIPGGPEGVSTTFDGLPAFTAPGARLLLDDGRIELRVARVDGPDVICDVVQGGLLGEHKGISLPAALLDVPVLTEKDVADLALCLDLGVDYLAMSFVQRAEDVKAARAAMRGRPRIPVIAKIEKRPALQHLDAIIQAFDGVMVARGDLGVETSPEEVPVWQKRIIQRANAAEKVVITATQMLESMVNSARPTRAEASDVANAVWDGSDAVMLSAETAIGRNPTEAVATMARIINRAESVGWQGNHVQGRHPSYAHAIAHAACTLTRELDVAALVVFTRTGRTAQLVSKGRPRTSIIAISDDPAVCRRLALWWGVYPVLQPFQRSTEDMIEAIEGVLLAQRLVQPGQTIVLVGSTPVTARARTNFLKVHRMPPSA